MPRILKQRRLVAVAAGIDICRALLQVCLLDAAGETRQVEFPNTPDGHQQLLKWLRPGVPVALEATANFSLDLSVTLVRAGLSVMVLNPRQARDFAGSLNLRAKTDRVDAEMLAKAALCLDLPLYQPPAGLRLELRGLMRRHVDLTTTRSGEKHRRHAVDAAQSLGTRVQQSIDRHIAVIEAELDVLEAEALELVAQDPELHEFYQRLVAIKGIGQITALRLVGEVGCLPTGLTARQWTAWAGLDPRPHESGPHRGQRRISKRGSVYVRRSLFMSVLVAVQHNPAFRAYYERLLARSKAKMVALVAAMRKLLTAAWALATHHEDFDEHKLFRQEA
ncbi:MAG TPA: IS110 family transposase [Steroidobacteraceae bacterium]|jgi:transposase